MAQTRTTGGSALKRAVPRKKTRGRASARPISELDRELPPNLAQFSRRVRSRLGEVERRWKRLTNQARRDALRVLRRVERELEPPKRRNRASTRNKAKSRSVESSSSGS